MTIKKGESWFEHLGRLEKKFSNSRSRGLHYNVLVRLINAADYGVPQKRERVFFVGFRSDLSDEWCFPEATHSREALAQSIVQGNYWERHGVPRKSRYLDPRWEKLAESYDGASLPWLTVRDSISNLPDFGGGRVANHLYQPGARVYKGHTGSIWDEPSKTLKAGSHGVPGGENMLRNYDGSVRYFTVRESARLQGFPDDFIFDCAWGESMRQIGNAVPVGLAGILAQSVKNQLEV